MSEVKNVATTRENAVVRTSQPVNSQAEVKEIDLVELALVLLDKVHYIALFFLIGAVLFNAYSYFCIHPTYESTSSIYVVSASGGTVANVSAIIAETFFSGR